MEEFPSIKFDNDNRIATFDMITQEFYDLLKKESDYSKEEIDELLCGCKDPEKFMNLYIKFLKSKKHFEGVAMNDYHNTLMFNLVDEMNRAYGSCIADAIIVGNGESKTYREYRKDVEEHKRLMAKRYVWTLWDIKNLYSKAYRCAIPERNGKVTKGQLITVLNKMIEDKILYEYETTDIIFEKDKNGNKIWKRHKKGQYNSYFRPGNTVHVKVGPKYKELK